MMLLEVIKMAKIMIVEDDMNIAKGLDTIIKSIKNNIETTITGYAKEALEIAETDIYDMFLLDIQLYDYSGFELAKELRSIDKYKLTPIVFITAVPTKELLAFKEIHCYDYIIKPFKKEEVIKIVSTLIKYGINQENKKEYISFNKKDYIHRVKLDEIIYLEYVRRKIKVVTSRDEILVPNTPLYVILDELSDEFIRCHKGYIVNINYIKKVNKSENHIELDGVDIFIPIGRTYKDSLGGVVSEYNGD